MIESAACEQLRLVRGLAYGLPISALLWSYILLPFT